MLSRVISGRDTERAQPMVFGPVVAEPQPAADPDLERLQSALKLEEENRRLRDAIHRLEADVSSAKRDSHDAVQREAFDSGLRQGEQQARLELAPVLERLHSALADFVGLRQQIRRSAEKDVVQLALLIAKRVLHREMTVDPGALNALARVVFERLARAESYRVKVHPHFADSIRAAIPPSQLSRVHIDADPACALGTLSIQSPEGNVDASIDTQLDEINRGLADRISHI